MKKILLAIFLFQTFLVFAQINVGTGALNSGSNADSVLLEFNNSDNKGIILPWVNNVTNTNLTDNTLSPNGTFVLDKSDKKVKVKINNIWTDLSPLAKTTNAIPANTVDLVTYSEKTVAKTIIGANTTAANGILNLESTTKAMVLPKFKDVQKSIGNPAPGMMGFDDTPGKEQICVYNGTEWTFWTWK